MNIPFSSAVEYLLYNNHVSHHKKTVHKDIKEISLPEFNSNIDIVKKYLISRGIDEEIIQIFHSKDKIRQDKNFGSCVFLGFDQCKNIKFATIRGTQNKSSFKKDVYGSDKRFSFSWTGSNETLIITESPIDLLSFITLEKMKKKKWETNHFLSLGGLSSLAITNYVKDHKLVKKLVFALDSDNAGRTATARLTNQFGKLGFSCFSICMNKKDVNEYLIEVKKSLKKVEREKIIK